MCEKNRKKSSKKKDIETLAQIRERKERQKDQQRKRERERE
jgi:hypothetical protein